MVSVQFPHGQIWVWIVQKNGIEATVSLVSLILCGKNDYASLSILEIGEGHSFFFSTDAESVPVFCLMG